MSRVLQHAPVRITAPYRAAVHRGIDLVRAPSQLDAVTAHSDGVVVAVATGHTRNVAAVGTASYGNYIKLDHQNGYRTLYAHLSRVDVKTGQTVRRGQVIGYMGNTGRSFGAHLHFEVRQGESRIDPTPYLDADLPPRIAYRAYTDRWLSEIAGCHQNGSDGYAGITGKPLTALAVTVPNGQVRYRVHLKDSNRWLSWVTGYDLADSRFGYAGNKGQPIDAVQVQTVGGEWEARYRVSTVGGRWHGWCEGLTDQSGDGFAGVLGRPIDRVQLTLVRKGAGA